LRSKVQIRVHAFVKNADDRQLGFRFAVEYNVPSNRMGAQTLVDIVAPGADTGGIPNRGYPEAP